VKEERAFRILMPTPRYLPHMGGVERYVATLSRRLVERGVGVTVLTTDPLRTEPPHERVDGVEIVRVPAYPRNRDYYFAPELYRIVRAGTWDLVHVQSYQTLVAPLAMLAARRARVPYLLTFHGSTLRRFQWPVLRPLLVRANRLVALARFEIDLYGGALKLPRDRFALIRTGIDLRGNGLAPRSRDRGAPVIASVGRLERFKGHHRLIEALPEILRRWPDARIWIAGSGPYEEALKRKARELEVAERVEIRAVPADDRPAMADELSRVALVVLFSDAETVPIAVLEALALGRPVLVTRCRGLDELADEGLVRAIPPDSGPHEIAAAVVEQLDDPFVPADLDLPTWEECAAQHHELYLSLVESSEGGVTSEL
jgi:glycosyltransferase involved in cell wall biosynthesis